MPAGLSVHLNSIRGKYTLWTVSFKGGCHSSPIVKRSLVKQKMWWAPCQYKITMQHNNGIHCGLFAISFLQFFIDHNKYLINIIFDQFLMWNHTIKHWRRTHWSFFFTTKVYLENQWKYGKRKYFSWKYTTIVGWFGFLVKRQCIETKSRST